jgi:hypothetical protein
MKERQKKEKENQPLPLFSFVFDSSFFGLFFVPFLLPPFFGYPLGLPFFLLARARGGWQQGISNSVGGSN